MINSMGYHIEQAINGLMKNKLMTLASIIIVSASIFVLVLSVCIGANLEVILHELENTIGITVYLGDELENQYVADIEKEIKQLEHVESVKYVSAADALEWAKLNWNDTGMLEGLQDDNPFPRSFEISIDDIRNQSAVITALEALQISVEKNYFDEEGALKEEFEEITEGEASSEIETETEIETAPLNPEADAVFEEMIESNNIEFVGKSFKGIEKIKHAQEATEALTAINSLVRIIGILLILIMAVISVGIIVNTIKLTVFVRKNEIGIMKFIGATDWFIRWPFIIEGVVVGLVGAIIPCLVCFLIYGRVYDYVAEELMMFTSLVTLVPRYKLFSAVIPVALLFSIALGSIGSVYSIRKHLKV